MRTNSCLFTLATVLCAAGCGADTPDEPLGESEAPVTRAPLSTQPSWAVLVNLGDAYCTGEVVNDRWILTAAHCLAGRAADTSSLVVQTATSAGVNTTIYSGPATYFVHSDYSGPSNAVHDVGLVYLKGWGVNVDTTRQTKLYADARKPWVSGSSEPTGFSLAGYGVGSDVGGTSDCAGAGTTSMQKRLTSGLSVDRSSNTSYATAAIPLSHACGGDSGAPYMLSRGGELLQFAVHSGRRGSPTKHQGPLIDDNFSWIDATIRGNTQSVYGSYWSGGSVGGYAYKSSSMMTRGWHTMVGLGGKCMHTTGGAGSAVQLRTCQAGSMNQSWAFYPDGSLRSAVQPGTWLCLEAPNVTNGTDTRLALCNGSLSQKFWYTSKNELRSALDVNKCIEVQGGFTTDGTPVQAYTCNDTASQFWID